MDYCIDGWMMLLLSPFLYRNSCFAQILREHVHSTNTVTFVVKQAYTSVLFTILISLPISETGFINVHFNPILSVFVLLRIISVIAFYITFFIVRWWLGFS